MNCQYREEKKRKKKKRKASIGPISDLSFFLWEIALDKAFRVFVVKYIYIYIYMVRSVFLYLYLGTLKI